MKPFIAPIALALALAFCGCTHTTPRREMPKADRKLDDYFQRYCGYTGNLGIGFVASHTYDYKYRQRLARTEDPELKRLYVLYHLYEDVDNDISELEQGKIRIGKNEWRDMSQEERDVARAKIVVCIDDLTRFDPGDPEGDIGKFKGRLQEAVATPAAERSPPVQSLDEARRRDGAGEARR